MSPIAMKMKDLLNLLQGFYKQSTPDGPEVAEVERKISDELKRVRQDMGDHCYHEILRRIEPENLSAGIARLAKIQCDNVDQLMTQYADDLESVWGECDELKAQLTAMEQKAIALKSLKKTHQDISAFANKTYKRSENIDVNLSNLEKRIGSWQCLIDEMKCVCPDDVYMDEDL